MRSPETSSMGGPARTIEDGPVAPVVTGISPAQGPTAGGNTVTIAGRGFSGSMDVRFDTAKPMTFSVVSDTLITAIAPAGAAGPLMVTITSPGGTSAPGAYYIYAAVPSLTSVTPSQGPLSGGNTVTLLGAGLSRARTVTFGEASAAFLVVSDTEVTALAPAGPAEPVAVTVTTPGGTSASIIYTRPPRPHLWPGRNIANHSAPECDSA